MALIGDGTLSAAFTQWDTGTGDFYISGSFKTPSVFAFEAMMGDTAGSNNIFYIDSGNTVKLKISSIVTITGMIASTSYPFTIERVGSIITFTCNGQAPTISFGGTNVPWDLFSGFGASASSKTKAAFEGIWTLTDTAGVSRLYNFNQPVGTLTVPDDGVGEFDATITGVTTGGYDGVGADSIVITSVLDGDFFNRDNALNEKTITITGNNIGAAPTSVEYRLDYGDWITLDASPAATFSGAVTVKNKQFLQVRGVGISTSSATITLTAGLSILAFWQSNEQGYGINTQPVNIGASSHTPLMFDGTNVVSLVDPVATVAGFGGAGGSTWPRIAKQYADSGAIICVYNIAKGGSLISEWQKGGTNYDKIAAFNTKVGGIGLATCIGGENDAQNGITQPSMETQLTQLVADLNTDFGCDTYICKFPMKAPSGNVATVFAAYDAVIAANSFAKDGGDLSVIDIETGTATGNDGVHLKQDDVLTQAANIRYSAQQAGVNGSSTLNLTDVNSSMPDGVYSCDIINESTLATISTATNVTFTSNVASLTLPVVIGSSIWVLNKGNNPPTTGFCFYGVTE